MWAFVQLTVVLLLDPSHLMHRMFVLLAVSSYTRHVHVKPTAVNLVQLLLLIGWLLRTHFLQHPLWERPVHPFPVTEPFAPQHVFTSPKQALVGMLL